MVILKREIPSLLLLLLLPSAMVLVYSIDLPSRITICKFLIISIDKFRITNYKHTNKQTYNKINGAIRRHFGKQMDKEIKLRIHNITTKAALKFGSEVWVLKKREEQRLEAAQMEFLRHLLGITKLDKEKNQCIRGKTGAQSIVKEIKQYQKKWLQHVQRMDANRLQEQALQYRPKGRRITGRPRKRWRDQLHLED